MYRCTSSPSSGEQLRHFSITPLIPGFGSLNLKEQLRVRNFKCNKRWRGLTLAVSNRQTSCLHVSPVPPCSGPFKNSLLQRQPVRCPALGEYGRPKEAGPTVLLDVGQFINAFVRFTRPHTMLGTAISVTSISLLAMGAGDFHSKALTAMLQALVSALLMNICIVGINQLYDVEIDKVNKPYLPLASGEFSQQTGQLLVVGSGAISLALGIWTGSVPLIATLFGSLVLGIAYSADLQFLRWKRNPVVAACCILAVRAVMVQLGFYLHMTSALHPASPASSLYSLPPQLYFTMAFMLLFSIVIALFKDVPDVAGDQKAGIRTLSVRLGVKGVFWLCIVLLELAYAGAIATSLLSEVLWTKVVLVVAHVLMGISLFLRARQTNLNSSRDIYDCYMHTWKLFYLEYILIPLFK